MLQASSMVHPTHSKAGLFRAHGLRRRRPGKGLQPHDSQRSCSTFVLVSRLKVESQVSTGANAECIGDRELATRELDQPTTRASPNGPAAASGRNRGGRPSASVRKVRISATIRLSAGRYTANPM